MKPLTARQVLARMKKGDLPHLRGGYTNSSSFSDGAIVTHSTMTKLQKAGKIEYPQGTSIHSTWTLPGKVP